MSTSSYVCSISTPIGEGCTEAPPTVAGSSDSNFDMYGMPSPSSKPTCSSRPLGGGIVLFEIVRELIAEAALEH